MGSHFVSGEQAAAREFATFTHLVSPLPTRVDTHLVAVPHCRAVSVGSWGCAQGTGRGRGAPGQGHRGAGTGAQAAC